MMRTSGTFRQYVAAISCLLCMVMSGAGFAWFTPIMMSLEGSHSEIPMTTDDISWIVASLQIGAAISSIPAGFFADWFGRKWAVLISAPIHFVSWVLVLTTRSTDVLMFVRILQGISTGIVFAVAPVYVAEISHSSIRGQLVGHMQTLNYVGNLYACSIGPYVSYQIYSYSCAILPLLFFFSFVFMPETPYYLLMVDRLEEAEKSLMWLRNRKDVGEELRNINDSVLEDLKHKGNWRDLIATRADRRSLFIVQVVCFVKYFSGMVVIQSYTTKMFKEDKHSVLDEDQLTIALVLVLTVTTFVAAYISDSIGRKPLLILSSLGSMLFTFIVGLYYCLSSYTTWDLSSFSWLMYGSLLAFCVINSIGLGPLMQTVQAEFFPSHTRGLGGGVTGVTAALACFIVTKQFQFVTDLVGIYLNYWIFSLASLIGTLFLWWIFPETAGKTLGEIQSEARSSVKEPGQPMATSLPYPSNDPEIPSSDTYYFK